MMDTLKNLFIESLVDLDENRVISYAVKLLDDGINPEELLLLLESGIKNVLEKYDNGEYFIADIIASGDIFDLVVEQIYNKKGNDHTPLHGKVLVGVAENDINISDDYENACQDACELLKLDVCKRNVCTLLNAEGYNAVDLGIDVSPEQFLEAAQAQQPDVLILCGALDSALNSIKKTIALVEAAGLRTSMNIILCGNCVKSSKANSLRADRAIVDLKTAMELCKSLMEGKNG